VVVRTQEIDCLFQPPSPQFPRSRMDMTPSKSGHKKRLPRVEPFQAGAFIIAKYSENGVDY
jgi:hypothetical protein